MSEAYFNSANWYAGLSVRERLATLRRQHSTESSMDADRSARRIGRWRAQAPLDDDELWNHHLATFDEITEEELRILAGESVEAVQQRATSKPPWLVELEAAYQSASWQPLPWPRFADPQRLPLLSVIEPLIAAARERLAIQARAVKASHPDAPFEPEGAVCALSGHLPDLLVAMLSRVMVVELHVARLEERLDGTTPTERFQSFVHSLRRRDAALEVLVRYPVLARELVRRIAQWRDSGAAFLENLATDAAQIRETMAEGVPLGCLIEARGAISDPHRDGRGVLIARFDSGLRVVYKPRSLAGASAFQALLEWVGERGFEPAYRTLDIIDAGDHGWMEFVAAAPCRSDSEVRRFYRRQGGYLALLYLLQGTDFHHENLIAAGEHPILVDLETLFQPLLDGESLCAADRQPGAPLRDTVLRPGLLPQRVWGDGERIGVDLSGLASREGQMTPHPVLTTTNRLTDEMRVERRHIEISISENRPRVGDRDLLVSDYAAEIRDGFGRLFRLLLEYRREFTAPFGPLDRFAASEARVILRNTAKYGNFLQESYHPHFLGNGLEPDMLLGRLWGELKQRPFLRPIVPYEARDLARGDVPHFVTRPGARDLYTSTGDRLADFFEDSGLDRVRRRLAAFSDRDLRRQDSAIHDSLEVVRVSQGQHERPSYDFHPGSQPARRDELLAVACRAGERLLERAFESPDEALWLTLDHRDSEGWISMSAGPDFYVGLPGIAFSLAYLGAVTDDARFADVARRALRAQSNLIEREIALPQGIGGFNGWGGVIYALTHMGVLWGDDALLDEAEGYARHLHPLVVNDDLFDLIAGSAGCILCVLALAEHRPSDFLLDIARACGERLITGATRQAHGIGWVMRIAGPRPLAGISHGAAGVALALLRLGAATGDQRFHRTAEQALAFEHSLYSSAERNWPDLCASTAEASGLDGSAGEHFRCAWCHGAPGIGLARLAGLPYLDNADVRRDIDIAISTTLERGFGKNHCLCHGDLGNLDFLLATAHAMGDDILQDRVYRIAGGVLANIENQGWLFGLPGNLETPGLMVGLAGVAYGLARLAEPEKLPSPLVLAAPTVNVFES
ncbi:MAG: type 2 lantipeptide synthetase LanM family protein [Proteobacteria bacterium]|nr:type 2 lantipeptide synthetase LanM family protein [Pseudomonadota bacterium]